jgi:AcrR family transcriptional regulator
MAPASDDRDDRHHPPPAHAPPIPATAPAGAAGDPAEAAGPLPAGPPPAPHQPAGPKPRRPHHYHHGDLRAQLLAAAETVLAERGLEGFTLRECARRAGVSHAAPAHHFRDVTGLLTAMAAIGFERLHASIAAHVAAAPDERTARYAAAAAGYMAFARENPQHFALMFRHAVLDHTDEALCTAASAAFEQLVGLVAELRARPDPLAHPETRLDVALTWATIHGLATLVLAGHFPFPSERENREATIAATVEAAFRRLAG